MLDMPPVTVSSPAVTDITPAYAGTIISTYPDGRTARLWLRPGGGYSARGRRDDPSAGHWRIVGPRLCLRQSRPIPVPFSYCTPLPTGGAGIAGSARAITGETITLKLIPGRAGEPR